MKKLIIFFMIVFTITGKAQDIICLGNMEGADLDLEDPLQYSYFSIDTNYIWFITIPEKQILHSDLPNNHTIITDTAAYYKSNSISSIYFKFCFNKCDDYTILFRHKYDFELNKDGGVLETSHDKGVNWQNIIYDTLIQNNIKEVSNFYRISDTIESNGNQPGFTGRLSENTTARIEFFYKEYMQNDTMLLRFVFSADSNDANNEGWMLDDFSFFGVETAIKNNYNTVKTDVFPNPANNLVTIKSDCEAITEISVISLTGELLIHENGYDISQLNIENLSAGCYLVFLRNKRNVCYNAKIIKL
jgi:hypothetical protein